MTGSHSGMGSMKLQD